MKQIRLKTVITPETVELIRECYLCGPTYIAKVLNEEGVKRGNDKPWDAASARRIMDKYWPDEEWHECRRQREREETERFRAEMLANETPEERAEREQRELEAKAIGEARAELEKEYESRNCIEWSAAKRMSSSRDWATRKEGEERTLEIEIGFADEVAERAMEKLGISGTGLARFVEREMAAKKATKTGKAKP